VKHARDEPGPARPGPARVRVSRQRELVRPTRVSGLPSLRVPGPPLPTDRHSRRGGLATTTWRGSARGGRPPLDTPAARLVNHRTRWRGRPHSVHTSGPNKGWLNLSRRFGCECRGLAVTVRQGRKRAARAKAGGAGSKPRTPGRWTGTEGYKLSQGPTRTTHRTDPSRARPWDPPGMA
jgi:hypothetical protein